MTMNLRDACPACRSQQFKKNGHVHNGKQNHQCKDCGRQFVVDVTHHEISTEQRTVAVLERHLAALRKAGLK